MISFMPPSDTVLILCLSCQIICRLQLTPAELSDPDLFCDYRYIQRKTGGYDATRFSSILLLKSDVLK